MRAPISEDELARMTAILDRVEMLVARTIGVIDAHMAIVKAEMVAADEFREYVLSRLEELQRGQR